MFSNALFIWEYIESLYKRFLDLLTIEISSFLRNFISTVIDLRKVIETKDDDDDDYKNNNNNNNSKNTLAAASNLMMTHFRGNKIDKSEAVKLKKLYVRKL